MSREEQIRQAKHIRAILNGTAEPGAKFTVIIEAAPDGGFFAKSADMRGLLTFERTIDKLMLHTAAVLESLVQVVLEGRPSRDTGDGQ